MVQGNEKATRPFSSNAINPSQSPQGRLMTDLAQKQVFLSAVNSLIALLLAGVLASHAPFVPWLLWLFYMLGIQILRLIAWRQSNLDDRVAADPWLGLRLSLWSFAAGIGWGMSGPLLVPPGQMSELLLVSLVVAGMAAGAMTALPAYPPAFYTFTLSALIPHVARLGLGGEPFALPMGLLGLIFLGGVCMVGHQVHRSLRQAMIYHFDNAKLVEDLRETRTALEYEMRRQSAELTTLLETVPAAIWIAHDRDARRVTGSRYAKRHLRLPPGTSHSVTGPEDQRPRHFTLERDGKILRSGELPLQRAACGENIEGEEIRIHFNDGSHVDELINAAPVLDEQGRPAGAVGAAIDITARRRLEEDLRSSERRFRDFATAASDWFWETDHEHRFVWMSENVEALAGIEPAWHYGKTRWDILATVDPKIMAAHREQLDAHLPFRDFEYLRKGPITDQWISTSGVPVFDKQGIFAGYRGVGRDVTERKRDEEKTGFLARHDPLTSLLNRRALQERLLKDLVLVQRNHRTGALVLFDLDRFKTINDTLGHLAGDNLLEQIGKRLQPVIRASDSLARCGGDEFALVMGEVCSPDAVADAVERLRAIISEPFRLDGQVAHVTASFGIVMFPNHGTNIEKIFRHADRALYRAKHDGRGCYRFYDAGLDDEIQRRKQLEAELRIATENGELQLHYQPQYDLASGYEIGAEALVRWVHPKRGLLLPIDFIPVAESCGLIHAIGNWVLEEACRQAMIWRMDGWTGRIAVNLSQAQLCQTDILASVEAICARYGSDGSWLELEITESMAMERLDEDVMNNVRGFVDHSISLALDDFGTGHSSLARLRDLPVNKLKIDQSFIARIGHSEDDGNLVRLIIDLGHTLAKRVVAEGVENSLQLDFLRKAQCDEVQGFALGRPQPPAPYTGIPTVIPSLL